MASPLSWTVDDRGRRAIVTLQGELDLRGTAPLRTALLKCLADQPDALLVDLAGMTTVDHTSLAVFTAVVRQAAMWPGTPVIFYAPAPETAALLAHGRFGRLILHDSRAEALQAVDAGQITTLSVVDQLLPISGTARHARNMVTDSCSRWSLFHLIGPASLVASELVTNAIMHAGTMMTFRITLRQRSVHIAVHDGSPAAPKIMPACDPAAPGGRGLQLVAKMAAHWGWLPSRDGKVVWARLATQP
jgi:anti-anti-sigma regulatory factor